MSGLCKCSTCGTEESGMKWCAKCKRKFYCSRECQTRDWNEHKKTCIPSAESDTPRAPGDKSAGNTPRATSTIKHGATGIHKPEGNHSRASSGIKTGTADGKKTGITDDTKFGPFRTDFEAQAGETNDDPPAEKRYPPEGYVELGIRFDLSTGRLTEADPVFSHIIDNTSEELKPMELQSLVMKVRKTLPSSANFFRDPSTRELKFITDFGQIKSDRDPDLDPLWTWNIVLLAKIIELDEYQARHGIIISDENYKRLVVYFYNERSPWPYFKWGQLKPGDFICIKSPKLHWFADGQNGFRLDQPDTVRILSSNGKCLSGK